MPRLLYASHGGRQEIGKEGLYLNLSQAHEEPHHSNIKQMGACKCTGWYKLRTLPFASVQQCQFTPTEKTQLGVFLLTPKSSGFCYAIKRHFNKKLFLLILSAAFRGWKHSIGSNSYLGWASIKSEAPTALEAMPPSDPEQLGDLLPAHFQELAKGSAAHLSHTNSPSSPPLHPKRRMFFLKTSHWGSESKLHT